MDDEPLLSRSKRRAVASLGATVRKQTPAPEEKKPRGYYIALKGFRGRTRVYSKGQTVETRDGQVAAYTQVRWVSVAEQEKQKQGTYRALREIATHGLVFVRGDRVPYQLARELMEAFGADASTESLVWEDFAPVRPARRMRALNLDE